MSEARVVFERVHGRDTLGPGGRSLGRLYGLTVELGPGIHAVLGRPRDGTAALCELVAGRAKPTAGALTVAGRSPWRSPALRRRIGAYLARPTLADQGRVRDALAAASRLRGVDALVTLGELGLGDLAERRLTSLRLVEAKALELALALAVADPLVIVLDEPLDVVELVVRDVFVDRLRSFAAGGTVVVITSGSPSDVEGLADHVHLLERGRLLGSDEALGWPAARPQELMIWVDDAEDARRLASALGERHDLLGVAWEGRPDDGPATVWVRAALVDDAAVAVAAAVALTDVAPRGLGPVAPSLHRLHDHAREASLVRAARGGRS